MEYFKQMMERLSISSFPEHQSAVILVTLCLVSAAILSVAFAARRLRRSRVHERRFVGRPVAISWRDGVGTLTSDDGFCRDLSAGGMALDLPFRLRSRTRLKIRLSEMKFSGTGMVRRCVRSGPRYTVGVEFDRLTRLLAKP
jgi:hypothetical protein